MSKLIQEIENCLNNSDANMSLYNLLNSYSDSDIKDLKEYYRKLGYEVDDTDLRNSLVGLMESLSI